MIINTIIKKKVLKVANTNWKKMLSLILEPSNHWRKEIIVDPNEKFTLKNNIGLLKNRIKYNLSKYIPLIIEKLKI